jgi:hypothetical protein
MGQPHALNNDIIASLIALVTISAIAIDDLMVCDLTIITSS